MSLMIGAWKFTDRHDLSIVTDVQSTNFVQGGTSLEFRFIALRIGQVTLTAINRHNRLPIVVDVIG